MPLILSYHAVSSTWDASLAISPEVLRNQLEFVHRRGYVGLTFAESEYRRRAGGLPSKSVVITFDDGFRSALRAKPILDALGYQATIFVVTSFVDSGEPLAWPGMEGPANGDPDGELQPLSWSELQHLVDEGWEVGSHTVTHPLLTTVSDDALLSELIGSRTTIAERLGSCESLAYPYGIADERAAAAAERAGYSAACTLRLVHSEDERYRRPRIGLTNSDVRIRLRAQLSPGGRRLRRSRLARGLRLLRRRRAWLPPDVG